MRKDSERLRFKERVRKRDKSVCVCVCVCVCACACACVCVGVCVKTTINVTLKSDCQELANITGAYQDVGLQRQCSEIRYSSGCQANKTRV